MTVSDSVVGRRRGPGPACRVAEPGSCDDFTYQLDSPLSLLIVLCGVLIVFCGVLDMCRPEAFVCRAAHLRAGASVSLAGWPVGLGGEVLEASRIRRRRRAPHSSAGEVW